MNDKNLAARAALPDDPTYRTREDYAAGQFNSWLQVTDEQPFVGLLNHAWRPFVDSGNGDGLKTIGFRRADDAGFVLPADGGRWWAAWTHPTSSQGGWHHHALGTYASAKAAAFAFDSVYALEAAVGNTARVTRADAQGTSAGTAKTRSG